MRVIRVLQIIFLIGLFWYLNNGSPFFIKSVNIVSDDFISSEKIAEEFQINDLVGVHYMYLEYSAVAKSLKGNPNIESVKFSFWNPGELKIHLTSAKPYAAIARQRGHYIIGENGQFIGFLPPEIEVELPIKLSNDSVLFGDGSKPYQYPWQESLLVKDLDESTLMLALGYRDLIRLRGLVDKMPGLPETQFIGYDEKYGLYIKCIDAPLILLGYGDNNLDLQLNEARKWLMKDAAKYTEDQYLDMRFERFTSVNPLTSLGYILGN